MSAMITLSILRTPAIQDCPLAGTFIPTLPLTAQQPEMGSWAKVYLHGRLQRTPFTQLQCLSAEAGLQVPRVFSEQGPGQRHTPQLHSTIPESLQPETPLQRCEDPSLLGCFILHFRNSPRELWLPLRSQNSRRHSFGEKGHALVLYLVLVSEAPIPLGGGLRWSPPQDPQLW